MIKYIILTFMLFFIGCGSSSNQAQSEPTLQNDTALNMPKVPGIQKYPTQDL